MFYRRLHKTYLISPSLKLTVLSLFIRTMAEMSKQLDKIKQRSLRIFDPEGFTKQLTLHPILAIALSWCPFPLSRADSP